MTILEILTTLRCSTPCLSRKMLHTASLNLVTVKEELSSNHEEADTKVILHCYHSRQGDLSSKVVLRSPSRDTDILVLATAILDSNRAHRDYGKGKLRKWFWLNQVVIEDNLKKALIGFHSFTGNAYFCPFSRKTRCVGRLL